MCDFLSGLLGRDMTLVSGPFSIGSSRKRGINYDLKSGGITRLSHDYYLGGGKENNNDFPNNGE